MPGLVRRGREADLTFLTIHTSDTGDEILGRRAFRHIALILQLFGGRRRRAVKLAINFGRIVQQLLQKSDDVTAADIAADGELVVVRFVQRELHMSHGLVGVGCTVLVFQKGVVDGKGIVGIGRHAATLHGPTKKSADIVDRRRVFGASLVWRYQRQSKGRTKQP